LDGDDEIRGLGAADELWGGFGSDVIYGGPGDDFLTGSTVNEVGHDKSKDVLYGGPGRDSVNGFGGDDVIYGGDGDDVERLWGGGARMSFAVGTATTFWTGPLTAGIGTSSIAAKAGTNTLPTRTTAYRTVARRR
jgi:Ca2+-binding RTX toxin-like protein